MIARNTFGKSLLLAVVVAGPFLSSAFAADGWSITDPKGKPFGSTRQFSRGCVAQHCPGASSSYACGPSDVVVSPSPGRSAPNVPFTIKYDATPLCNGQSVEKLKATISWDGIGEESLGDSYGYFTKTFPSGGDYKYTIKVTGDCVDGQRSTCQATGASVVNVSK